MATGISENDVQLRLDNIYDLDEKRRAALYEIDELSFGWFHIRTCVIAGIGFFTDAYDLFVINLISAMLGVVYFQDQNNTTPPAIDLGLKVSAAGGTLIGQLVFGVMADRHGRKKMYGVELMIMIVATIGQALASQSFAVTIYANIIFWRVVLGIGIGGDYPMSAVITSEFATRQKRGAMLAAVFAMQGIGILTAAVVSLLTLAAFKTQIYEDRQYVDYVWRIVTGAGVIPAFLGLYFRVTIPETPRYTMDIERDIDQATRDIISVVRNRRYRYRDPDIPSIRADAPRHSWQDFKKYFSRWENAKVLLGTSLSWFVLDVAFYGIGLNNGIILTAIGFVSSNDPYTILWTVSVGNIIVTMLGTVPGYWFTVFLVDSWGRKFIQFMGFSVLTIIYLILGIGYNSIKNYNIVIFIALYTLANFFQNFGPNSTTFIVPGEVFPTRYRSTGHGISAASGKLGALVAQVGFLNLKDLNGENAFVPQLLIIFSGFMLMGVLFTFLIPESRRKTLEDLSNEDQTGFVKGKGRSVPGPIDQNTQNFNIDSYMLYGTPSKKIVYGNPTEIQVLPQDTGNTAPTSRDDLMFSNGRPSTKIYKYSKR